MNSNVFPDIPSGMKMKRSTKRLATWTKMKDVFDSGIRPESFEEAYELSQMANGQYKQEAKAIWGFLRNTEIHSIVEIGRNLAGNLFLMACAARKLKSFLSIDLLEWSLTDNAVLGWFKKHGIDGTIQVCDSLSYSIPEKWKSTFWDFVYIDGGHTGEVVRADIENWKDKTKYIGFHDFADLGSRNKHRRVFKDLVQEIKTARDKYGWVQCWDRGRSEIIFRTQNG